MHQTKRALYWHKSVSPGLNCPQEFLWTFFDREYEGDVPCPARNIVCSILVGRNRPLPNITCAVDQFLLQSGSDEENDLLCIGSVVETYTLNIGIGLTLKIEFWMKAGGTTDTVDAVLNLQLART